MEVFSTRRNAGLKAKYEHQGVQRTDRPLGSGGEGPEVGCCVSGQGTFCGSCLP